MMLAAGGPNRQGYGGWDPFLDGPKNLPPPRQTTPASGPGLGWGLGRPAQGQVQPTQQGFIPPAPQAGGSILRFPMLGKRQPPFAAGTGGYQQLTQFLGMDPRLGTGNSGSDFLRWLGM